MEKVDFGLFPSLFGHTYGVNSVAISKDGNTIVSGKNIFFILIKKLIIKNY